MLLYLFDFRKVFFEGATKSSTAFFTVQLCLEISIFFELLQPLAVSSSVTVHCRGERKKNYKKPCPIPYGLRYPYRNLKSENSQDYAQKPQRSCTFMNSA